MIEDEVVVDLYMKIWCEYNFKIHLFKKHPNKILNLFLENVGMLAIVWYLEKSCICLYFSFFSNSFLSSFEFRYRFVTLLLSLIGNWFLLKIFLKFSKSLSKPSHVLLIL